MDDQDAKLATGFEPTQRAEAPGEPAIDGDHTGESLGVAEPEPVGDRGPFADPDEEDPLGVDVKCPAGLPDRGENAVLQRVDRVGRAVEESSTNDLRFGEGRDRPWRVVIGPSEVRAPAMTVGATGSAALRTRVAGASSTVRISSAILTVALVWKRLWLA